jgi:acyl dehydratase
LISDPQLVKVQTMKIFHTLQELALCVGQTVAVSPWTEITQTQVNQFAEATGDHQWIHIDVEKAKAGPFGGPIAHGFLTLSLIPMMSESAIKIEEVRMGVNYGLNKVRFTSPVPVGSKLRGHMKLLSATTIDGNGMQFAWEMTIEREGAEKPACIAESLARYYV